MDRISISRLIRRWWMLLVAVAVVGAAGFGVYRLHGIFGSHNTTSTAGGFSNEIVPFNPKHVVLEVFGPPGAVATINYLDVDAQPQRVNDAPLPWSYDVTTTEPAVVRQRCGTGQQRFHRLPHHHRRRGQRREIGQRRERLHLLPGQVRMSNRHIARPFVPDMHPAVFGADRAGLAGAGGGARTSSCRSWRPSAKRTNVSLSPQDAPSMQASQTHRQGVQRVRLRQLGDGRPGGRQAARRRRPPLLRRR